MAFYYSKEPDGTYSMSDVEVSYIVEGEFEGEEGGFMEPGWYYRFCFPGCIPEGEYTGPFDSEEAAVEDMRNL